MEKTKFGRFLENSSSMSQIILAGVAIFAYFYTVRPIYQNQLLSEEISSKELELRKIRIDFNKGIQAIETLGDTLEILKLEKDSLSDVYNEKFHELDKRNRTLLGEVLQKESTVKEVQSNIIRLHIRDYIERIYAVAVYEMSIKTYEEEAKKWLGNYKEQLINLLSKAINNSFGYGRDYGLKRLPDSVRIYLEEKSIKILDDNKSNIFNNYDVSKLSMALNRLIDVRKTCDTTDIRREIEVIQAEINKEEVRNREELEKTFELSDSIRILLDKWGDCIVKLSEPPHTIRSEILSINNRGISEFISLLYKELKYKEY